MSTESRVQPKKSVHAPSLDHQPPCYANRAEYKGKCYMPVSKDRSGDSPAQAVDP
jgi:hypothetical protein